MTQFTKSVSPLSFPSLDEEWTNGDGTVVPANTLVDKDTMLYSISGIVYTYKSESNSWTGGL